jgi:uncharacterized metal-binding protein
MLTIRIILYSLFILFNFTVLGIITNLQNQDKCKCNTGWKPENIKLISQLGIFIGIINIILPINKTLYSIPIVNTIFSVLCLCIILMYIFTMVRYFRYLRKTEKCRISCKIDNTNEGFVNAISTINTGYIILISIIITILILYI